MYILMKNTLHLVLELTFSFYHLNNATPPITFVTGGQHSSNTYAGLFYSEDTYLDKGVDYIGSRSDHFGLSYGKR